MRETDRDFLSLRIQHPNTVHAPARRAGTVVPGWDLIVANPEEAARMNAQTAQSGGRPAWMALGLACLVGACSALHRDSVDFTPTRQGFKFRAIAEAAYPENTEHGEASRLQWLEQRLAKSGTCPHGYDIISRKPVLLSTGALGGWYDVYYVGRCRAAL